jgi:Kef-type K+ transport system membrane component KefB
MGINFTFDIFSTQTLILILILLFVAISSKMIGTFIGGAFDGLTKKKLFLIGWAMNSRGAIELVILLMLYRFGFVDESLYSALIIVAFITTILFPIIAEFQIKKNPTIMN